MTTAAPGTEDLMPVIGVRLAEGRSGSTLLMQLLSTAPTIAFDRAHPAERRFLSYFVVMAARMTAPWDEARDPGGTAMFFGPDTVWGPVPFASDVVDVSSLRRPLLRAMWSAWSTTAAAGAPVARAYAEKLAVPVEPVVEAGIPLRVIDLLRDPRDVLASVRSFTANGTDGFGRRPGENEDEHLAGFLDRFEAQVDRMAATPGTVERLVVRYEDLVANPFGTAERIGTWLGVELDVDAVIRDRPRHEHHITSGSVERSVGRWERDLRPGESDLVAERLGPAMEPFGYRLRARPGGGAAQSMRRSSFL